MLAAAVPPPCPDWTRLALLLHARGCPLDAVNANGDFALLLAAEKGGW